MGCFSIPKNKSKVAAASQQAEQKHQQNSNSLHHGSKLEQLLSSGVPSGLSSNTPVVLPDPDDLSGRKSQGAGSIPAAACIRGGGKQQQQNGGKERGGSASYLKNSSTRLSKHRTRTLSATFNSCHSYPPTGDGDRRPIQGTESDDTHRIIPFSAPLPSRPTTLDGNSSPVSPHGGRSHGSPLHPLSSSVGGSEVVNRGPQPGLDKKVMKAFNDKKGGSFTGRPARLPKPQTAAAHPLPLPNPPELDEGVATGLPAGFTNGHVSATSVSPSPSRGKEGVGPSNYGFRSIGGGGAHPMEALPLPPPALPTHSGTPVRAFPFGELAPALVPECFLGEGVFGRAYRAWIDSHGENSKANKIEVAVVCPMVKSMQGLKEWMAEVNWLARLQNARLCRLIGYSAEDASGPGNRRLLVYEFMNNGSLDMFIRLSENSSRLDWSTRMRIALDVAQGLAYLHDKAPFQVICRDVSSPSIQLNKEFRAKLSGFGLARCGPEGDQGLLMVGPYVAPESGRNGLVTIKSNAWSFGVVLLEMLTGRRHMDASFPSGQQNLIQLTKPFLRDEGKLFLIMDPELNGRYSGRGALKVANLAFQCLINEASLRPNLSEAVEVLRTVQIDEEALSWDLRKSRSLTQSVGSPVTYSGSASDHFVQRAFNSTSLTSSPSHPSHPDRKQQDREFLKLMGGPMTLGTVTSSPSYVEGRLSTDKTLKSIFSDRDAQKLPLPLPLPVQQQQPFESRQMHGDNVVKLRKASLGGPSSTSFSSDYKRLSSSTQVHGQGEVTKLQAPNLTGPMQIGEMKQPVGQPKDQLLTTRSQVQESSQSSETNVRQGREITKLQAPQLIVSQYGESQLQLPDGWNLNPQVTSSRRPRSCELKPTPEGGWKFLSRQSSLSTNSRSGEQKLRISDLRKLPVPQNNLELKQRPTVEGGRSTLSRPFTVDIRQQAPAILEGVRSTLSRPVSGEIRQQGPALLEGGRSTLSRPLSGEIRHQAHAVAVRKMPPSSHLVESTQPSFDITQRDGDFQKRHSDDHSQLQVMEEHMVQKSLSQSSASSRLSCAPALSFDPPMIREEFCVW